MKLAVPAVGARTSISIRRFAGTAGGPGTGSGQIEHDTVVTTDVIARRAYASNNVDRMRFGFPCSCTVTTVGVVGRVCRVVAVDATGGESSVGTK